MKKFLLIILSVAIMAPFVLADTRYYKFGGFCNIQPDKSSYSSCDPFVIRISGYNYYMVVDAGSEYSYHNILGCSAEQKEALFDPLRELDTDKDKKITSQELKEGNIRFVRLDIGRRLALKNRTKDFDLDDIVYIDLKTLRVGSCRIPMGSFDLYLYPNKKTPVSIIGKTFALMPNTAKRMVED